MLQRKTTRKATSKDGKDDKKTTRDEKPKDRRRKNEGIGYPGE